MNRYGRTPSRALWLSCLLLLFAVVLVAGGCARPARAQPRAGADELSRRTVTAGGVERSYLLNVPRSYKQGTATPLVIVLHGLGGSGAIVARQSNFAEQSEQSGFIVAFPDGAPLTGQRNLPGWRIEAGSTNPDTAFIAAMLDQLQAEFSIDRVFVAGHSNGGALAYRLACDLSDRITAIGVVSGFVFGACAPARPVPVLHIHGTADTTVPYAGGRGLFDLPFPSVDDAITRWRTLNGCEGEAEVTRDDSPAKPTITSRYAPCRDGSVVELITVEGGGHEWPGGLAARRMTENPPAFAATPALWGFFAAW